MRTRGNGKQAFSPKVRGTPADVAAQIRSSLTEGGSAKHAEGVQSFFKDAVKSHGWYTADLRRAAIGFRRDIRKEEGLDFLVEVADQLFAGSNLEEKAAAVFLLEKLEAEFRDREFNLFESWLDRITSWADHDALVHSLIAPLVARKPARIQRVFRWAASPRRWHRRAACVSLIRGTRARMFFPEITKLSNSLLNDKDDMVQKGLGWLLRETAKSDPGKTVPYLMKIRAHAPRLVLRTACETLPAAAKKKVLARVTYSREGGIKFRNSSATPPKAASSKRRTSGRPGRA